MQSKIVRYVTCIMDQHLQHSHQMIDKDKKEIRRKWRGNDLPSDHYFDRRQNLRSILMSCCYFFGQERRNILRIVRLEIKNVRFITI